MIDNNVQLLSWGVSIFIGFIYTFLLNILKKLTININFIYRLLFSFLFVLMVTILFISIYYKVNSGLIHYSYVVFWLSGGYLFYVVKSYVKRHKK